jgi:hypothetical protein
MLESVGADLISSYTRADLQVDINSRYMRADSRVTTRLLQYLKYVSGAVA